MKRNFYDSLKSASRVRLATENGKKKFLRCWTGLIPVNWFNLLLDQSRNLGKRFDAYFTRQFVRGFVHSASTLGARPIFATRPQDIPILLYLFLALGSILLIRPSGWLSQSVPDFSFYLSFVHIRSPRRRCLSSFPTYEWYGNRT